MKRSVTPLRTCSARSAGTSATTQPPKPPPVMRAGGTRVDGPRDGLVSLRPTVKTYARGHGTTYPDLPWEPKQAFGAVASFYATH